MSVIVRTSFDNAKRYYGKGVVTKIGNKKHNVFFKVIVDDFSIDEALKSDDSNIVMFDYRGMVTNQTYLGIESTNLYVSKTYEYGSNISEQDIVDVINEVPKGVVPIIKLPDDYKDFEFICRVCDKYDRVRFCGGTLFCADGCRIGCCGRDVLDNAKIKYPDGNYIKEGCACALDIISDEGLELEITDKKVRSERKKSSSGVKRQKTKMFGDLLGGFTVDL